MTSTRSLQSRADCKANFDLIRSWISQCDLHPACARVPHFASEFQLPARLIDIGTDSGAIPRLVVSSDLDEAADRRYVALSHCWGDPSKVPKTVRATLGQHQERITGLSKTFEDAIEVMRQIGMRYLWIDSLCIVQQDAVDWEIECTKMSFIYARAYCVLSAMDAADGSVGLFIPRSFHSPYSQIDYVKDWELISKGPLSTRGWAFQEHQLSTRIVHFTRHRLLWECRACVAYEDSPAPLSRVFLGNSRSDFSLPSGKWRLFDGKPEKREIPKIPIESQLPRLMAARQMRHDIYTRWLNAVEVYSSRSLTFSGDRLPALSGLAATMSAVIGENNYLAGIWENDILRGLLWKRVQPPASRSNQFASIPSWSWASYDGQVCFPALKERDYSNVFPRISTSGLPVGNLSSCEPGPLRKNTKCCTTLSSLDPFGQVKGGTLQITTYVKDVIISASGPGSKWSVLGRDGDDLKISLDNLIFVDVTKVTFAFLFISEGIEKLCYGLILQKANSDSFQRIGIFWGSLYGQSRYYR